MKKVATIIAAILVISTSYAQGISFGPKVGMNISKLTNVDSNEKLGLNIGAFFTGYFTSTLGIEVSAMFSQEGSTRISNLDGFGENAEIETKLNYLNIPVVMKLNPIGGLNFFAGPQFGMLLSASDKIGNITVTTKDGFHKANLSGVVGIGYRFIENFDIAVNYNFMLTKSTKDGSNITLPPGFADYEIPSMRGNTWQLTLGFAF